MKSKARIPAKTIKNICHPSSVAMMKNKEWLEECQEAFTMTSKIRGE
jgi:hypothetical protein